MRALGFVLLAGGVLAAATASSIPGDDGKSSESPADATDGAVAAGKGAKGGADDLSLPRAGDQAPQPVRVPEPPPTPVCPQAPSAAELEVLRQLRGRAAELDARSAALDQRERTLSDAEKVVFEAINDVAAQLYDVEAKLNVGEAKRTMKVQATAKLADALRDMAPRRVAPIFASLEPRVVQQLLVMLPPEVAAEVLGRLPPASAALVVTEIVKPTTRANGARTGARR